MLDRSDPEHRNDEIERHDAAVENFRDTYPRDHEFATALLRLQLLGCSYLTRSQVDGEVAQLVEEMNGWIRLGQTKPVRELTHTVELLRAPPEADASCSPPDAGEASAVNPIDIPAFLHLSRKL